MADILFIKTSSLGDVIHHMPALTEARRQQPGARLAWMVEEAFAPLVRLHPDVDEVIPVAWRRWRKSLYAPATLAEIGASLRGIRAREYERIIDTQGLMRSALMARIAHGVRHGYDRRSIKESLASFFYDKRYRVGRDFHAIDRNRILTGLALGYAPRGAPDYGLRREKLAGEGGNYAVLLHATARTSKEWPEENWIALGRVLEPVNADLVLPWGNNVERARAERIAAAVPRGRVADRMAIDGMARVIAGARFVVGLDTGLLHLAAALGVPLTAIFTGSKPSLTGPAGPGPIEIVDAKEIAPSVTEVQNAVARILR